MPQLKIVLDNRLLPDDVGLRYGTLIPCSLAVQIPKHCHILQLVVRSVLVGTLDIPAAAPDVIGAKRPMGVKPVAEAGGGQWQLRDRLKCFRQPVRKV